MGSVFLRRLAEHLSANGVSAHFEAANESVAYDQVLFSLDDEREMVGSVGELPDISPRILQLYVPLPATVPHNRVNQVARTVCAINGRLPLTGFEFNEQRDVPLSFRMLTPRLGGPWELVQTTKTLAIVLNLLGQFIPIVVGVADGDFDFKTARKKLAAP